MSKRRIRNVFFVLLVNSKTFLIDTSYIFSCRKLRAPEEMLIQEIHPFAQKLVSMGFPEHSSVDAVNSTGEKGRKFILNCTSNTF